MPGHIYTAGIPTGRSATSVGSGVSQEELTAGPATAGATGGIADTAVLNEDVVAAGVADSMNAQPNPPDYTDFVLVEGLQYVLKGVGKPTRYRFIDEFRPNFMIISESDIDQGLFLLTRRKHYAGTIGNIDTNPSVEVQAYTGIEEESLAVGSAVEVGTGFHTKITYSPAESSIFFERYGYRLGSGTFTTRTGVIDANALQLQISITTQASIADPNLQNSTMEPELISYDELSSLGSITQENITISETTTSDGTLISTPDEEITDIGGGRRRSSRVITATAATSTSTSGGSTGGSTGGTGGGGTAPPAKTEDVTVTTSGGY